MPASPAVKTKRPEEAAEAVGGTLEAAGCRVVLCSDGLVALLMMAAADHYDLLLFDDDLPGFSGLELVRYARRIPHRAGTPVVMLSAGEREREAREAGADLFLRKPQDFDGVAAAVRRLLAGA